MRATDGAGALEQAAGAQRAVAVGAAGAAHEFAITSQLRSDYFA